MCFGYKRRGRGACCVPPPSWSVGAAACYSPTSCRMQYHRRARSSLPGSEWVRASPLGHGRRKSVIIIPYASRAGGLWWVGDRMVDACVLKDRSVMRGVSPRHPSNSFVCLATLSGGVCVAVRLLVPVSSTPCGASTSGLSTMCSAWSLQTPEGVTES